MKKKEIIDYIENTLKQMDNLPPHAWSAPLTHYDYYTLLGLFLQFFKEDCKEET